MTPHHTEGDAVYHAAGCDLFGYGWGDGRCYQMVTHHHRHHLAHRTFRARKSGNPAPLQLDLSEEEVRRFQQIIRETSSVELTFGEAKERALEVLRLSLMLVDPDG